MRGVRRTAVAVCLLAAGCGGTAPPRTVPDPPASTATATSTRTTAVRQGTRVIVADSRYGRMLYDASGQPIYLFDRERTRTPACYEDCATAWPPVLTGGDPVAGTGVRASLLGTTKRRDGRRQVTYAGHPLYFYAHEGKYQVRCHDVTEFGGTWLVVRPDGTPAP